jgi:excisionase family DNA binding protein
MSVRLELELRDELFEAISERAAAIVLERLDRDRAVQKGVRWLTLAQAAERLGCSPDAVRMRVRRGRLEHRRQGRRLYVSAASVDELG